VQENLVNPASYPYYWLPYAAGTFDLLVVTTEALSDQAARLVDYRNARGSAARLVFMSDVRATTVGRDDPEKLKRVLWSAYHDHGMRYVMLAGDATHVPVRYRSEDDAVTLQAGNWIPSDHYYSDLDNPAKGGFDDWDANHNGVFNEEIFGTSPEVFNPDQVAGRPDVALGRVPAHTATDMGVFVDKVMAYEAEAGFRKPRATFLIDRDYGGASGLTSQIEQSWPSRNLTSHLGLNYAPNETLPAPFVNASSGAQLLATLTAEAARSEWMIYMGHGGPRCWGYYCEFGTNEVNALSNASHQPIVFAAGCETGQMIPALFTSNPDIYQSGASFANDWLFKANGGGVAYFGEELILQDTIPTELAQRMLAAVTGGDDRLGDVWLKGEQKYWDDNPFPNDTYGHRRIYPGIMNVYGDPMLRLHHEPRVMYTPGDFNGDGKTDVIITNATGSYWYYSTGLGTWNLAYIRTDLPLGSVEFVPGDFNGDGKTDLIITTADGSYWYYSTGLGTWNGAYSRTDLPLGSATFVPADFDGDGKVDVIITTADGSYWYYSTGTGTWVQAYSRPDLHSDNVAYKTADFDGDNKSDVIITTPDGSYWYRSTGRGTWDTVYSRYDLHLGSVDYVTADFNGDGKADMIVTTADGSYWYYSTGVGTWNTAYTRTDLTRGKVSYVPADFDTVDLFPFTYQKSGLIITTADGSYWYQSTGTGTWNVVYTRNDLPLGTVSYSTGNFDGDAGGKSDVIISTSDGSYWYYSNGNGTWNYAYTRPDLPL
jgi:hypothetical protein